MPGTQLSLRRLRQLVGAAGHPRLPFWPGKDVDGRNKSGHDVDGSGSSQDFVAAHPGVGVDRAQRRGLFYREISGTIQQ
jgi:hypothetical protein